jgi:hypothetical protein
MALGVALSARSAPALDSETFDDYKGVGVAEDARRTPAPLSVDGHSLDPSFNFKLADILTPHVFGAETFGYSDNLFDTPPPSAHTPFERSTVGGRGDVQLDDHVFSLGYRASLSDFFKLDSRNWLFEDQADARLDLNFNELRVHLDGIYARTGFPQLVQVNGFNVEQFYQAQGWVEGTWNRIGGKLGMYIHRDDFEHTGADLANRDLDHTTLGVDAQFNFQIYEKLVALAEYDFETDLFDESTTRSFDAHQFRVGVNGTLSEKLALSIKVGYTYQELRGSNSAVGDSQHYSGFDAASALSWQALPSLTLSLAYRHDLTWAIGADFEQVDSVDLGAKYTFGPADKITAKAGFSWIHATPDVGPHYDRIQCLAALSYQIQRWLSVLASYQYTQGFGKQSAFAQSFNENRVGVSVAIGF